MAWLEVRCGVAIAPAPERIANGNVCSRPNRDFQIVAAPDESTARHDRRARHTRADECSPEGSHAGPPASVGYAAAGAKTPRLALP